MMKKLGLYLFTLLAFGCTNAQLKLSGKVTDMTSNKGLPSAAIYFKNQKALTNSDGLFDLQVSDSIGVVRISKDGFAEQTFSYNLKTKQFFDFSLDKNDTKSTHLEEVTIKAAKKYKNKKENPAYPILEEVWKRNYKNAFDGYQNYKYEEYQKIEASLNNIDSTFTKKKMFKGMEFMFKKSDSASAEDKSTIPVFLNETISDVYKQNQPSAKEKRILLGEKAAGFENNQILLTAVQNLYKDFNIYDNTLNFFNKGYVSPLSTSGFATYDYELLADNIVDGEPCYTIKFLPKNNAALVFRGVLYISKEAYAVKKVTLNSVKNSDVNFIRGVNAELTYKILDEKSFIPEKSTIMVDMAMTSKSHEAKGMYVTRTISYRDFDFNKPEIAKEVEKREVTDFEGAHKKGDDFWAAKRHDSLSTQDQQTYSNLEKLWKVPKFKMAMNMVEIISSGYVNAWNSIDFGNLYSLYGHNKIEGSRIRLGARTYFSRNDMWRAEGYLAYGFLDKKIKYGAEARYMFNQLNRFTVGASSRNDVIQLGSQLIQKEDVMNRAVGSSSVASRGDNIYLSRVKENHVYTSIEPFKNFQVRLDASYQELKSAAPELFSIDYLKDGIVKSEVNNAKLDLEITYRPSAKYSQYGVDRHEHRTLTPTFILNVSKGFAGVFNSDFNYEKVQFAYVQPMLVGKFGRSNIRFDAGKTFGSVPLSLMTALPGNQSYNIINNSFAQLNYYEFVVDSYATLIYDHHFNGYIFNKIPLLKKLKLREVVFFRSAWGSLTHDNMEMNRSSIYYTAPKDHIYYEYGFGIENIGFGNFRLFRVDFNWRGNYLDHPDVSKFGIKAGIRVGF